MPSLSCTVPYASTANLGEQDRQNRRLASSPPHRPLSPGQLGPWRPHLAELDGEAFELETRTRVDPAVAAARQQLVDVMSEELREAEARTQRAQS